MAPIRNKQTTNRAAMPAMSSSPKTGSGLSETDQEQIQVMVRMVAKEKRRYIEMTKAETKKEVEKFTKKAATITKRHQHLIKTHVLETNELYESLTSSLEEIEREIKESSKHLGNLLEQKQDLAVSLETWVKEIFSEADQEIENCVQALEDIVLGIAAKPKDKTNGLVGKDLERDVQAELEAIKAGYQTSEQTGDHHEMMEGVS